MLLYIYPGAADVEEAMEADDDGMPPLEVTMHDQQAAAGGQPEVSTAHMLY